MKSLGRAVLVVALACALPAAAPDLADAAGPWREVAFKSDGRIESDGVRFAWTGKSTPEDLPGLVRVFDTLRSRSFWHAPPIPGCSFGDIGGGLALWHCPHPRGAVLVNLATGFRRRPVGIESLGNEYTFCTAQDNVGRHWLEVGCRGTLGPASDPMYLNHRTGSLSRGFVDAQYRPTPRIDVNGRSLIRPLCKPLQRAVLHAYTPPFALETPGIEALEIDRIRLRRCGRKPGETLSRCRQELCHAPQLGSRYVTWAEYRRVFAYLPRIRRRLLVGRAPAGSDWPISVAHTCDRVFAQWGRRIYVARFQPREGAPPCQR